MRKYSSEENERLAHIEAVLAEHTTLLAQIRDRLPVPAVISPTLEVQMDGRIEAVTRKPRSKNPA